MSIKIIKPGLFTTLVDAGRTGFRSIGISTGGAMDSFAMNAANYLVGNHERAATMEIHFPGPEILFENKHTVCVTGKGLDVLVNDEVVPMWKPLVTGKGSTMKFLKVDTGGRAYLATHGGWKAQEWLGSFSTNVGVQAGGFRGRALEKNDALETEMNEHEGIETKALPWGISKSELDRIYFPSNKIRCLPGAETDLLSPSSVERLLSSLFTITPQSNRMGYRLVGTSLSLSQPVELISSPVDFGTIQLLPDGNLIILMADHQTTGGYPRIASVIKADLPKLAQLAPGEKINFEMISFPEAESELLSREKQLADLKNICLLQFKKFFKT